MLIAHYIGPPKPGAFSQISHWAIRTGQRAPFDHCTHTEAIHAVHADGAVTMASSSTVDKGVRTKRTRLTAGRWVITDVPAFDVQRSVDWFAQAIAQKMPYDSMGALATMLPGKQAADKVFCTEAVLLPFVQAAHYYTPALGLSLSLSIGRDITQHFFAERAPT